MKTLRDIGEDSLIARVTGLCPRDPDPAAGPGDDCAVIDRGAAELLLFKTDALVAGVHFLADAPARAVGWKAVARVVSDFAAMGGRPEHFLVTLALPGETAVSWVEDLYRGVADCLETCGGFLAGGETSSAPAAVISIAATGSVRRGELVLRSTARPGDAIFVTGRLGGSLAGKHLSFMPRLAEAGWLAANCKPTAMMDLSDGLAADLPRLAAASGCRFRIDESALPLTPGRTPAQALGDGEDFELVFTVSPANADRLPATWPFAELPLTRIGEMRESGGDTPLAGGWQHFRDGGL